MLGFIGLKGALALSSLSPQISPFSQTGWSLELAKLPRGDDSVQFLLVGRKKVQVGALVESEDFLGRFVLIILFLGHKEMIDLNAGEHRLGVGGVLAWLVENPADFPAARGGVLEVIGSSLANAF